MELQAPLHYNFENKCWKSLYLLIVSSLIEIGLEIYIPFTKILRLFLQRRLVKVTKSLYEWAAAGSADSACDRGKRQFRCRLC
jgi:hypothetical protein